MAIVMRARRVRRACATLFMGSYPISELSFWAIEVAVVKQGLQATLDALQASAIQPGQLLG